MNLKEKCREWWYRRWDRKLDHVRDDVSYLAERQRTHDVIAMAKKMIAAKGDHQDDDAHSRA